jgi:hypothetical protein
MFGINKHKEVFQFISTDDSRRPIIVSADNYKDAEKALPNEYREDLRRGKAKMSKLS